MNLINAWMNAGYITKLLLIGAIILFVADITDICLSFTPKGDFHELKKKWIPIAKDVGNIFFVGAPMLAIIHYMCLGNLKDAATTSFLLILYLGALFCGVIKK